VWAKVAPRYGICCAVPQQLPRLDLVLWLIKADDRALAVDEHFYHQVIGEAYRHKVLFVISQSDKAEPTSGGGQLSTAQKQNISRKSACCMSCSSLYIRCVRCRSVCGVTGDGRADD
jgi:predicted GTPase